MRSVVLACALLIACTLVLADNATASASTKTSISTGPHAASATSSITLTSLHVTGPFTAERWAPPLGSPLEISRAFSLLNGPYGAGHRGIDIPAFFGQVVSAPTQGTVTYAGVVVDRPVLSIRIDAHTLLSVEPVTSGLSVGERVERGQAIGSVTNVGAGGHCESTCLHLGVRVDKAYVNPMRFLRLRPALLPWS